MSKICLLPRGVVPGINKFWTVQKQHISQDVQTYFACARLQYASSSLMNHFPRVQRLGSWSMYMCDVRWVHQRLESQWAQKPVHMHIGALTSKHRISPRSHLCRCFDFSLGVCLLDHHKFAFDHARIWSMFHENGSSHPTGICTIYAVQMVRTSEGPDRRPWTRHRPVNGVDSFGGNWWWARIQCSGQWVRRRLG